MHTDRSRIEKKEEKCTNYREPKYEIAKIWRMRKLEITPVLIGTLGTLTKHFEEWIEKLDFDMTTEALRNPCLLGTTRIIQKVLYMKIKKKKKKKMKKKKIQYLRQVVGVGYCGIFYQETTSDLRVKK